jgi:hypothetical protein
MTQPSAANSKLVDKNNLPQIGDQVSAITTVTIATTATADPTYGTDERNMLNNLKADVNALKVAQDLIISCLENHGLLADN